MRAVFQILRTISIVAPLPAIESLRADAEIPAGEASVLPMRIVIIEPF